MISYETSSYDRLINRTCIINRRLVKIPRGMKRLMYFPCLNERSMVFMGSKDKYSLCTFRYMVRIVIRKLQRNTIGPFIK